MANSPLPRADIGVIGGSGFYSFFADAIRVRVSTPFGEPSDEIVVGDVSGRAVAFFARHGQGHRFPPHRVNYRANLWALRMLGVRQVLAPCAVGSLRPELTPGTIVVPDQVVDRTWGRAHTVYDEPGPVVHVSFADPFCPRGRAAALKPGAAQAPGETPSPGAAALAGAAALDPGAAQAPGTTPASPVVDGGTLVVINGPRFSTAAEARWHQSAGWSLVGMTTMPEAAIARELAMCFTTIALVTDHDAGIDGANQVTHADVLAVFAENMRAFKERLRATVAALPDPQDDAGATCGCRRALDGQTLPFTLP